MYDREKIDKNTGYGLSSSKPSSLTCQTTGFYSALNSSSNNFNKYKKPLALEVGVGTNKSYAFKTKIPVSHEPFFLDIESPTRRVRKIGNWIIGDAQCLPFRISVFDMVCAYHVIEHLDKPEQFLMETFRILRKGGKLDLATPNFLSNNATLDLTHKHVFNIFKILKMIRRVGFQIKMNALCGSKIPKPLRIPLHLIINFIIEELRITCIKP